MDTTPEDYADIRRAGELHNFELGAGPEREAELKAALYMGVQGCRDHGCCLRLQVKFGLAAVFHPYILDPSVS